MIRVDARGSAAPWQPVGECSRPQPPGRQSRQADDPGGSVVITVSDNGRGMDAETVKRLFDRYFRGTASDSPGSGLGMAIARQLIEASGGTIEVLSEPGRGTVLAIHQPVES